MNDKSVTIFMFSDFSRMPPLVQIIFVTQSLNFMCVKNIQNKNLCMRKISEGIFREYKEMQGENDSGKFLKYIFCTIFF